MARLAPTLLVAFLLAGTAVAFAVTQGLKLEKSPIYGTVFDEVLGPSQPAWLRFRLRKTDTVTATVVDADGHVVRTLVDHERLKRGRIRRPWDGRTNEGALAPQGIYHLRVRLADRRGTILIPNDIRLDSTAPELVVDGVEPVVFSPDRDGRADRVIIRYRTNESSRAILFVNGRQAVSGRLRKTFPRGLPWAGRNASGDRLPPGRYVLRLRAEDAVGNLSALSRALVVRLRYIDIAPQKLVVRAGQRFRVPLDTDARTVRWRIAGRSDLGQARSLRIRAPAAPGRYRLYVTAKGHADTAFVVVRPAR